MIILVCVLVKVSMWLVFNQDVECLSWMFDLVIIECCLDSVKFQILNYGCVDVYVVVFDSKLMWVVKVVF